MFQTEIRVKGKISPEWSTWFEELDVRAVGTDETILSGSLPDMAAVYGILSRLGSLVITLVSVTCMHVGRT